MRALKNICNSWNMTVTTKTKVTFNDYPNIVDKYKSGVTLQVIGEEYGVSRERIRQILKLYGIARFDGGMSTRSIINCREKANVKIKHIEDKEKKIFEAYGCSVEFLEAMRGDVEYRKSPLQKYRRQKQNARTRGIGFELTLHEWWDIWEKSGHWDDMGLGKGKYHMSRTCDIGPYSIDNVEIKLHEENSKESRLMDKVYNRIHTQKYKTYSLNGINYTLIELANKFNIKQNTIRARLNRGISLFDACTQPLELRGRHGSR